MGRGRKPTVEMAKLEEIFNKYSDTCRNKNIKYNHPIFTTIAGELDNKMTPKSLHQTLKRHFNTIFSMNKITSSSQSGTTSPSCQSAPPTPTKKKESEIQEFSFLLDVHEAKKVEPLTVNYKRRDESTTSSHKQYRTIPKYKWSSLLREKIWRFSRLPCTFAFKTRTIDQDNNLFIKGNCTQCECSCEITSKPETEKTLTMFCKVSHGKNKVPHDPRKKSKMTPYKRRQLAKKLEYKSATFLHKDMARKIIKDEDVVSSPVLPSLGALRKVKHEKRQGKRLHSNPILSILMLSMMMANFIRELTLVPNLRLYYWCEQQIQYYKAYLQKVPQVTMTIDATGSFFQPIKLPDGSVLTKRVFLYVAMLTASNIKSTAIFQMLTDSHTSESILSWLKKWYTEVGTAPHEIITDDSSALIAASVQAFTQFHTVREYLKQSFLILKKISNDLPPVFLRLDTSHFIKNIYNLRCFENIEINVKMLYIRSILYIKECETFDAIKNIVRHMIKICLTRSVESETDYHLTVSSLKSALIATKNTITEDAEDDKDRVPDDLLKVTDEDDLLDWFNEMVDEEKNQKHKESQNTDNINEYYLPCLIPTLKRLLTKLPLWSNVMCYFYNTPNNSPTSSSIESYFKTLKHLVFESRKYKIDEFLKIHYNYLMGETRLAVKDLENSTNTYSVKCHRKRKITNKNKPIKKSKINRTFTVDSIFSEEPSYTENWRGEAYVPTNIPSILFLKNGNLHSTYIGNTCALDSICYMLAYGYKTNVHIRQLFESRASKLIRDFINLLADSQKLDAAYKIRDDIIVKFYKSVNNIYDCTSTMAFVFEHIFATFLFSAVRAKECVTTSCKFHEEKVMRNITFLSLNLNILDMFGITSLAEAIDINFDSELKWCYECTKTTIKYSYELSNIILFELNDMEVVLNQIPLYIEINHKTFKLIGALEYIPPPPQSQTGHYRCHCLVDNTMICYDDIKNKTHKSSEGPVILHCLMYGFIEI